VNFSGSETHKLPEMNSFPFFRQGVHDVTRGVTTLLHSYARLRITQKKNSRDNERWRHDTNIASNGRQELQRIRDVSIAISKKSKFRTTYNKIAIPAAFLFYRQLINAKRETIDIAA